MVKHQESDYEHVQALPISTREDPTESAGLLNGSRHISTFDVEFEIEDDMLLDLQQKHAAQQRCCSCCSCIVRLLPERFQQPPDWWWRLSQLQRKLLLAASFAGSALLLLLCISAVALTFSSSRHGDSITTTSSSGSSSGSAAAGQRPAEYKPRFVAPDASLYCTWDSLYLPKVIRPTHYKLHISTDMQEPYLVEGEVEITLSATEETPCVVLHAKGIEVSSVVLLVYSDGREQEDQTPVEVLGSVYNSSSHHQQLILQFPSAIPLAPMQPVLKLQFSYHLTEGLDGFYRSTYIDAANATKVLASTQFESIAARKAFPCFDEPAFKATFEVKISAPPPPVAVLSNMPLSHTHGGQAASSGSSNGLIAYHFDPTPPMSTYLVAWVVGELAAVEMECQLSPDLAPSPYAGRVHDRRRRSLLNVDEGQKQMRSRKLLHEDHDDDAEDDRDDDGHDDHDDDHDDDRDDDHDDDHGVDDGSRGRSIPVRVFGTTDRAALLGHAKEAACHALQTLEELLQVAYPLPKLDLVAIPNFAAGAMENWGLLMYRETALLVNDEVDDIKQQYAITTTVAHEMAHQWFGDLVTLGDWTQLWLNEGFATYFEVVAADAYRPTWGYFDTFLPSTTSPGLEADQLITSHPLTITQPAQKLSEIDNWFDDISYNKGAAVLRMLRAWLNKADAPMLGFSGDGSSAVGAQHARHRRSRKLQQLLSDYLKEGSAAGGGNTVDNTNDGSSNGQMSWWLQKVHFGSSTQLPKQQVRSEDADLEHDQTLDGSNLGQPPVLLPTLKPAPDIPMDNSSSRHEEYHVSDSHSGSGNYAGSGSSANWWFKKSHFGGATAIQVAEQVKAQQLVGGEVTPEVLPAVKDVLKPVYHPLSYESPNQQDPFLRGLKSYLQELSYGTANHSQLWAHLEASSGQPVADMMATWTLRRGFPVVTVSLGPSSSSSGSSNQLLSLSQVPYHAPRTYMVGLPFTPEMYCNDWSADPQDSSWWIPVALQVAGANSVVQWHAFDDCSTNVTLSVPHNGWVLANVGRYGFYRVNYSEPLWTALAAAAVDRAQISGIDFAGLLDDAYALSLVRQLNITTFMTLAWALGDRFLPEQAPWDIALGWLQRMSDVLASASMVGNATEARQWQTCSDNLNKFVTEQITGPFIQHLEVPGQATPGLTFDVNPQDSPELRLLRPKVLTAAGFLGHTVVMQQAAALLQQAVTGKHALHADVAKAVYSLAVGSGDEQAYATVQRIYEQAVDPADKDRALRALARATSAHLISKTLDYALTPAVRSQDVAKLFVGLAKQGGVGFNKTWEFIINRAQDILKKYGVDDVTYSLGRPLNTLAKLVVDQSQIDRIKQLEEHHPGLLSPTFLDEASEARILNRDWLRLQGVDACAWLARSTGSTHRNSSGDPESLGVEPDTSGGAG